MPETDKKSASKALSSSARKKFVPSVAFYSASVGDAMAVLRLLGPARAAGATVLRATRYDAPVDGNPIMEADIVVTQREFSRDYDLTSKIVHLARQLRKPLVLDLDDLLLELPENHPDRQSGFFADALLPLMQIVMESDLVTVATKTLREYLLPYNPNTKVISNYLDDSLWKFKTPKIHRKPEDPVTIGYMGGYSHEPDLRMVLPALLQLLQKYPERVQFRFWGIQPPSELVPYSTVDWYPPDSYYYTDFAKYFQTQTADIFIAPLCDNLFNSCKSPIKFFEYSALGIPGVYSHLAPYADSIEDGKEGLLASSTEGWVTSLSELIDSPEIGIDLVRNAQKKIRENWLLSKNAYKQFEIYQDEIANYGAKPKSTPFFLGLIKTIASQNFEKKQKDETVLQALKNRVLDPNALSTLSQEPPSENSEILRASAIQISALSRELDDSREQVLSLERELAEKTPRLAFLEMEENRLKNDLQASQTHVEDLENEVATYVVSRSWRWTRPLRKIFSKLQRQRRGR